MMETCNGNEQNVRLILAQKIIRRGYRFSITSPYDSFFNFDVSVSFRQWKNKIYLIPHCSSKMRKVLDFLNNDVRLVDYHYQNQTDRLENISAQAWDKRAKVWDGIFDSGQWEDVLFLEICSWNTFLSIDPFFDLRTKVEHAQHLHGQC